MTAMTFAAACSLSIARIASIERWQVRGYVIECIKHEHPFMLKELRDTKLFEFQHHRQQSAQQHYYEDKRCCWISGIRMQLGRSNSQHLGMNRIEYGASSASTLRQQHCKRLQQPSEAWSPTRLLGSKLTSCHPHKCCINYSEISGTPRVFEPTGCRTS